MASVSKNMYIDKLGDIINKYNNTHNITIRMKPFDVKSSAYFVFIEDNCYQKELQLGCCSSPRSMSDVKWKGYNNLVNSRIDKKDMAQLSNYETKADLQNATGVDISGFAKTTDLAHLKSDVDKLDIDQLKNVTSGLSNLKSKVDNWKLVQLI